jgi:hypothetical protein
MKLKHLLQTFFAALAFTACGSSGGDDPEPTPTPTVTAPTVVSTTPANNATDIPTGVINVQVVYDKDILVNCVAVEKFLPLICERSAESSESCFDKSHDNTPFGI